MRRVAIVAAAFFALSLQLFAASTELKIDQDAKANQPFSVAGPRAAILGTQDGVFEAWVWPIKVLSDFRVNAKLADYPVTLDLNKMSSRIIVEPHATTIVYSHIGFTVRQVMYSPQEGRAAYVVFEIDSDRALELNINWVSEMRWIWPAKTGSVNADWDATRKLVVLNTDDADVKGAISFAGATPEGVVPYQEAPTPHRFVMTISYDPKRDHGKTYPMILTVGTKKDEAFSNIAGSDPAKALEENRAFWRKFIDAGVQVETPDERWNRALLWARVAVERSKVMYGDEPGMIAGYYASGSSSRPGFAWFFGRDTLWSVFALNSSGNFTTAKQALEFLIRRQRDDGKIMHEFSQGAFAVDWKATPYFYASADATPLFVIAMNDYLRASGDTQFVQQNWAAIKKAYDYGRAHDSDHDGFMDNAGSGHGWIESGPYNESFQESYLAALWIDAQQAFAQLAQENKDTQGSAEAQRLYSELPKKFESIYLRDGLIALGKNKDGSLNNARSILPSVALWNSTWLKPTDISPSLDLWSSYEISTDWGTRIMSDKDPKYDAMSYHNGSVWPLFTGWVSLAEYRAGRPYAAFDHLFQNMMLTFEHDPGFVTELLSGDFYQPFGRSTPAQMWSSAMVTSPFMRGLLGLEADSTTKTIRVAPQLPANWDHVKVSNWKIANDSVAFDLHRVSGTYELSMHCDCKNQWKVTFAPPAGGEVAPAVLSGGRDLKLTAKLTNDVRLVPVQYLPRHGNRTMGAKIIRTEVSGNTLTVFAEGLAGTSADFALPNAGATSGLLRTVHIAFPASSERYSRTQVKVQLAK